MDKGFAPGPSLLHFLSDADVVSVIEEAGCFDSDPLDSVVGKRQHDNRDLQDEGLGEKMVLIQGKSKGPEGVGQCTWHVPEVGAPKANVGCGLEKTGLRSQRVPSAMVQQMAAHKGVSTRQ